MAWPTVIEAVRHSKKGKDLQAPECLHRFRQEKIGIRGRANRRPTECADSVCEARCGRRVDNNRYSVICVPRRPAW
nr:MAG TPA: hypothetical protein [Caudoviricetes sp.]